MTNYQYCVCNAWNIVVGIDTKHDFAMNDLLEDFCRDNGIRYYSDYPDTMESLDDTFSLMTKGQCRRFMKLAIRTFPHIDFNVWVLSEKYKPKSMKF